MITGIIIGFALASALYLGAAALNIKKADYQQQLNDMGKKHSLEKIILEDRNRDLEAKIREMENKDDIDSKYTNNKGLLTSRKESLMKDKE